MPVPQENSLFVEQASCLFLRMVQDVSFNRLSLSAREFIPRLALEASINPALSPSCALPGEFHTKDGTIASTGKIETDNIRRQ
ncbi:MULTISPECIES: hypothetical protein, partial [unclassified Microcoleus]|uniref:hypothetical protein n=1 Tax=unclassified Microcoleus TaxID=2642155 RepID=UPI002FCFCF3E